jgi:hypothetical protein
MLAGTMKCCAHRGYPGEPVRETVWLVPLVFLAAGYWPFFLLPAVAMTAWVWLGLRPLCPACRAHWKT